MIARHKTNTERRVPTDSIRRTKYSNIRIAKCIKYYVLRVID